MHFQCKLASFRSRAKVVVPNGVGTAPVCPHEAGRPVLWQKVFAILPSPLIAQNPEATRVVTWFLGTPFLGDRQFAMMGIRPHTQIINQMQIALPLARAQCIGNVI